MGKAGLLRSAGLDDQMECREKGEIRPGQGAIAEVTDLAGIAHRLEQVIADLDQHGLSLAAALAQNALDAMGPFLEARPGVAST